MIQGVCAVCGCAYRVMDGGTLEVHKRLGFEPSRRASRTVLVRCEGSGRAPKKAASGQKKHAAKARA
jgi:hypothetical protein